MRRPVNWSDMKSITTADSTGLGQGASVAGGQAAPLALHLEPLLPIDRYVLPVHNFGLQHCVQSCSHIGETPQPVPLSQVVPIWGLTDYRSVDFHPTARRWLNISSPDGSQLAACNGPYQFFESSSINRSRCAASNCFSCLLGLKALQLPHIRRPPYFA